MSSELQVAISPDEQVAPIPTDLLAAVIHAASDPRIDVEKMKALLEMKERIDRAEAERQFNIAMNVVQSELRPVVRDSENQSTHSKYTKLEKLSASIGPVIVRNGFSVSYDSPATEGSKITVGCTLAHCGGFSRHYQLAGDLDTSGPQGKANKTAIQGLGSTVSYLRRYLKLMMFDVVLVDQDNDGQSLCVITDDQADNINTLMNDLKWDQHKKDKFLIWAGASSIELIQSGRYGKVIEFLQMEARK